MPQPLVLGSSSPFRRELLERLHLPFVSASPDIDEQSLPNESAYEMVKRLSEAKARAIAKDYPHALIIGSDQCAVLGDTVLGKPGRHEVARQQLRALSGHSVIFLTGLCLYDSQTDTFELDVIPFTVEFRHLSDTEIENYLLKEQPYHCAGSFKSEGLGISLFKRMQGDDPSALIGLPLIRLMEMLRHKGWIIPSAA
ncbi:MAG: septum formation inhibitor Maf [Proteobacteria bacterium]|nr:MAG: septum formation inhibitor Maf [Pseudomonadota bacterium]